ncbi:MAG: hypothetical protein M3Z16_09445 [Pseudomonadota bacterium]|nr:hypothetical protein [Pseudomonadota bacterium]
MTLSDHPCADAVGLTPAEAIASAAAAQKAAILFRLRKDCELDLRRLLTSYPDPATHRKALFDAVVPMARQIRFSEQRLTELNQQRKPLEAERDFWEKKPLPPALRQKVDASDAAFNGLTEIFRRHQADVVAVEARFAAQLARLKPLWARASIADICSAQIATAPSEPSPRPKP